MLDMLFGRMKVILFLDIPKFGNLCNLHGYKLQSSSGAETEETVRVHGRRAMPFHNKRILKIVDSDGSGVQLLGGTFHKIFFDVIRPSEVLRMTRVGTMEMNTKLKQRKGIAKR